MSVARHSLNSIFLNAETTKRGCPSQPQRLWYFRFTQSLFRQGQEPGFFYHPLERGPSSRQR